MGGKLGLPELLILLIIPGGIWLFGFFTGIAYAKREKKTPNV